jgi:hypothetical protein
MRPYSRRRLRAFYCNESLPVNDVFPLLCSIRFLLCLDIALGIVRSVCLPFGLVCLYYRMLPLLPSACPTDYRARAGAETSSIPASKPTILTGLGLVLWFEDNEEVEATVTVQKQSEQVWWA